MRWTRGSLFLAAGATLAACAADTDLRPARPPIVVGTLGCPMDLPGSRVRMTELDGAIALDFTTPGDVSALRTCVRRIGTGADAVNLDRGVRVTLSPVDPREYDELETRVRRAVFELNHGDCSSLRANWLELVGPDLDIVSRR